MKKILLFLFLISATRIHAQVYNNESFKDLLPKGYVVTETIKGDINNNGLDDYVLIVKNTDQNNIFKNDDGNLIDRNRQGIIVVLNNKGTYVPIVKNYSCFSSENKDRGVYYSPEMSVSVEEGKLFIHFAHGRYGYSTYAFKLVGRDFQLNSYDESNSNGPTISSEVSINFLTKKKLTKENLSEDPEKEVFKENWTKLKKRKLIKLSTIEDFGTLDFS